jgi:hypothetical protein
MTGRRELFLLTDKWQIAIVLLEKSCVTGDSFFCERVM